MKVVIHSFDVFELLTLPFDNGIFVLNVPGRGSVFLLFYFLQQNYCQLLCMHAP